MGSKRTIMLAIRSCLGGVVQLRVSTLANATEFAHESYSEHYLSQHVSSYCPYYHGAVSFAGIVHVQASLQGGIVLSVVHSVFMLAPEKKTLARRVAV